MKFFTLFIIFNLSSLTFVQAQEDFQTEDSIWEIHNDSSDKGAGFFISPNLFVTTLHILSGLLKNEGNS